MRCTQIAGLQPEAQDWLEANCRKVPTGICKHCGKPNGETLDGVVYDGSGSSGMFEDGPHLQEYTTTEGKKVREVVQAAPWSSGPVIFLCLEIDGEQMFRWPEDKVNNA